MSGGPDAGDQQHDDREEGPLQQVRNKEGRGGGRKGEQAGMESNNCVPQVEHVHIQTLKGCRLSVSSGTYVGQFSGWNGEPDLPIRE